MAAMGALGGGPAIGAPGPVKAPPVNIVPTEPNAGVAV